MGARARLAGLVLAVACVGSAGAQDEEEPPLALTAPKPFDLREALTKLAQYDHEHPGFLEGVAAWIAIGAVLYLVALVLLLYSEIRTCLIVRDQDFRKRLLETQCFQPGDGLADLKENEHALLAPRAYVAFGALLLFIVALGAILFPLCDIFTIVGLPSGPCLLMLTIGAVLAAVAALTGWMALVWSCTRPYAAFVLAAISVSGHLIIPTGNLLLILVWSTSTCMGGSLYFYYLPGIYDDRSWSRPGWLQDIGDVSVSLDPKEWSNSLSRSYEAHQAENSTDEELSLPTAYQ